MDMLLHNLTFINIAMAFVVFLLTNLLKMPIKALTVKIKNEKIRKRVNSVIYIIPFALGVIFDILYCKYYLNFPYSIIRGLGYGTAAITLYHTIEQNFKIKVDNPFKTKEGKAALEMVEKVTADGKVDENDVSAVKDFWEAVK